MFEVIEAQETDTASTLCNVGRLASRCLAEFLAPTDLTARTGETLLALRDAAMPQQMLAERLDVHPVTLVALLNDLERRGLITRRRDIADRRRHTVALSELGRARMAAIDIAREKRDAVLFKGVTAAQRATLAALLERIAENVRSSL